MITNAAEAAKQLSPLMNAILAFDEAKAISLIKSPDQVHAVGPFGWTALHVVSMTYALNTYSNAKMALLDRICDALLKAGANHLVKDAHYQVPMVAAQGSAPPSLRKHVAEYCAANPEPDTCWIVGDDGDLVFHRGPQRRSTDSPGRRAKRKADPEHDAWMDSPDLGVAA